MTTPAKKTSPKKKRPIKKARATTNAQATKKPAVKPRAKKTSPAVQKVDYYPNRMIVAVSVLAVTLLVLLAMIAVLGAQ